MPSDGALKSLKEGVEELMIVQKNGDDVEISKLINGDKKMGNRTQSVTLPPNKFFPPSHKD